MRVSLHAAEEMSGTYPVTMLPSIARSCLMRARASGARSLDELGLKACATLLLMGYVIEVVSSHNRLDEDEGYTRPELRVSKTRDLVDEEIGSATIRAERPDVLKHRPPLLTRL